MYLSYFGLAESPFSSTPDRRFVYLSERHREGFAHLLYGLREQGGFVQLTGEVGTGKTTLCRYLLERLPSEVDVALILNPVLTAAELLATVCDELRVPYPSGSTSLKVLGDALHRYLLDAHARGRRTVLIVDEAQHLDPAVLEQMRLLTNLETATAKLLQIILIGQPELIELLRRPEIRQVAQRVAARYHLQPLSERETHAYILYRVGVAGQSQAVFDDAAIREVHRRSRGIPRLINIICDRALLGSYALRQHGVDAAIVREAAQEVFGETGETGVRVDTPRGWRWAAPAAAVLVVAGAAAVLLASEGRRSFQRHTAGGAALPSAPRETSRENDAGPARQATVASVIAPARAAPRRLDAVLADPTLRADRQSAFAAVYAKWGVDPSVVKPGALGCDGERPAGLRCLVRYGTAKVLRRVNLPAVLELVSASGERRHAAITAIDGSEAALEFGERRVSVSLSELDSYWDGAFTVLWRSPRVTAVPIAPGTRGKDVAWLGQRIAEITGAPAPGGDLYDDDLRARVVAFQRAQSLVPDGIVGEETLARLVAVADSRAPSLAAQPR